MRRQFRQQTNRREQDREDRPLPSLRDISELRRLVTFASPYVGWLVVAVIALLLGTGINLVFPWVMQNLVDAVLAQSDFGQLNNITGVLIGLFLIRAVFAFVQGYTLNLVGERIVLDLRKQTYAHLHTLDVAFFNERRVGELISRLSSDVTLVRAALTTNVATVLGQSVTFIGSIVLMVILNWRLMVFILVAALLIVGSAVLFGRQLRKLSTDVQDELAGSAAIAEEALSGVRTVKAFTREPYEIKRYDDQVRKTFRKVLLQTIYRSAFGALVTFLGFAALAAVLWYGGREVLFDRLTAGSLIAFLVYGINIVAALGSFTGLYTQLQEALGATKRIFELFDASPQVTDPQNPRQLDVVRGEIQLEQVSFRYSEAGDVLKDVDLTIQPGEVLALVGPSGAGKSTMFNLLQRFYDPSEGRILLDGVDMREMKTSDLRNQIAVVPQETQLFSDTIIENIRYGRLDASQEEIEAAAQAANADGFIREFGEGYQTQVGERGVKLSGGQRQRIAIARAVLRDARILLLDEATSSLDTESERAIQEALERLMNGRTTLIIAHRLSTIQRANRIAVLQHGEIVELGSHEELLARDGLYARLYKMQFREGELNFLS